MSGKRSVYLDHAAATPVDPRVLEMMRPYFSDAFGNPSALYTIGRQARQALDRARTKVAAVFHCAAEEIVFTGSGTESDNLALFGVAHAYASRGKSSFAHGPGRAQHLIVSAVEHHAVLNSARRLEKEGWSLTILPVDSDGRVNPQAVRDALTPETTIVSVMYANNEIGTIEPVADITKVIREYKRVQHRSASDPPFFHTDACQAASALDLDVQRIGVDLLTINGSKIYGPKGVGALFVRRGIRLEPLLIGGGQERRLRAGTENIPSIIGLATALEIADAQRVGEGERLVRLRDQLIAGILERIPRVVLNGHPTKRLPNNANVSILDIEGEAMLLYLDQYGISAATGSACDSESLDPSHVIIAIGRSYEYAHASVRFTLGRSTTEEDIAYVLDVLPGIVERLRKISPIKFDIGTHRGKTKGMRGAFTGGRPHWEQSSRKP